MEEDKSVEESYTKSFPASEAKLCALQNPSSYYKKRISDINRRIKISAEMGGFHLDVHECEGYFMDYYRSLGYVIEEGARYGFKISWATPQQLSPEVINRINVSNGCDNEMITAGAIIGGAVGGVGGVFVGGFIGSLFD